jgi:hypothetical protein
MLGKGRSLSWKQTQEVTKTEGLAMSLATPESVQKLQTALHDKAKRSPDLRFYVLYDKVYRRDVLSFAYKCSKANDGAAGVDNQTFEDIEAYGVERWLDELTQELKSRTYRPLPVRRMYIPKPGGKQRPLGVPTIRDGAVMMAAVLVLDPIFEADLPPLHDVSLHHMIVEGASNRILLRTWDSLSFEVRIQLRLSKGKVDLVAAQEIH